MKKGRRKNILPVILALIEILGVFVCGVIKNTVFNGRRHQTVFAGSNLFGTDDTRKEALGKSRSPEQHLDQAV